MCNGARRKGWSGMVPSIRRGGLESPGSGQRHNEGKQAGSLNHRAALPPLLPFGLDPDEHFEAACTIGQYPLPTERSPVTDTDLQFAAYMHAREKDSLSSWRRRALGILRELKRRWAPVTDRLRSLQTTSIAGVMAQWGDLLSIWPHHGFACGWNCALLQHLSGTSWEPHHVSRGSRGYC
jgi:hypothetical protein